MPMNIFIDNDFDKVVGIKVVGVGGGGGNAVNRMVNSGIQSVDFIAINTDNQALYFSKPLRKFRSAIKLTRAVAAGGGPDKGQRARG